MARYRSRGRFRYGRRRRGSAGRRRRRLMSRFLPRRQRVGRRF